MGIRPNGDVTPCPYLPVFGGTLQPIDFYVQAAYVDFSLANVLGITNAVQVQFLP